MNIDFRIQKQQKKIAYKQRMQTRIEFIYDENATMSKHRLQFRV